MISTKDFVSMCGQWYFNTASHKAAACSVHNSTELARVEVAQFVKIYYARLVKSSD